MRIEGHLDTHPRGDRRESARRELHLLVASLAGQSPAANVLVLDLSQTGLLLQTSSTRPARPKSAPRSCAANRRPPWSLSRAAIANFVAAENAFRARLRRLRTQYKLSQTALAKLLNVTKLSVWKWDAATSFPRAATVAAMAKLFVVSESELLTGALAPMTDGVSGADEATGAPDALAEIVEECKARIAAHLGTTTDKVEIPVSL